VPAFADRGCRVVSATDPHSRILGFLDRSRYYFFPAASQLHSRGWVDPVPDPLLLRKSGSAGNRNRELWICSQEFWPLDHRGGHDATLQDENIRPIRVLKYLWISVDWLHRQTCCTLNINDGNCYARIISCLQYRMTLLTHLSNAHNGHQVLQVKVRQAVLFRRNSHTQNTETRKAVSLPGIVAQRIANIRLIALPGNIQSAYTGEQWRKMGSRRDSRKRSSIPHIQVKVRNWTINKIPISRFLLNYIFLSKHQRNWINLSQRIFMYILAVHNVISLKLSVLTMFFHVTVLHPI
jgi:hypothetical protein